MGQGGSSPQAKCLLSAVGGNADLVAFPTKPLYQLLDVHPYNLDISVAPIAVTYPKTADQVAAIVACAGSDFKVQARGGGHSYANYALGGGDTNTAVVDLKNFQDFSMDTNSWQATIGAGTKLGDVTSRLLSAGNRAIAHGTCPDVGIGGHATMGGLGPMSRMWGSAMDHVIEVQVVLANASIVAASPTQNRDVFGAMKGAGSSFGIVTDFKVETHPAPGVAVQYTYTFSGRPYANLASRFKAWQTLISDPKLSRNLASQVVLSELGMEISGTFFGTKEDFNSLGLESVFPDHSNATVLVFNDWAGLVGNWAENVGLTVGGVIPSAFYSKNLAFTKDDLIPNATVDQFFRSLDTVSKGTLIWFAIFDLEGGATNDPAANATAYGHRDALFYLQTYGVDILTVTSTTRAFLKGMDDIVTAAYPPDTLGSYAGYVDPELANAQQAYYRSNLPRLEQLKGVIDPKDVFHNPESIKAPS
ncbi:Berberine bridge enzyme-like protein [Lachnellula cervina]|uniref:Berberine bridge enzyme-like protein n=1 Tax=Lachnellula cervina TaxID=1316786 RepID=A0A7D8UUZ1_9HELO|nr:Berberine bridge enzyme-like protein [Lachnellula cervina]